MTMTSVSSFSLAATFNHTVLTTEDRYEIFQLIDGYLKGKDNRRSTTNIDSLQEELNLKFKD